MISRLYKAIIRLSPRQIKFGSDVKLVGGPGMSAKIGKCILSSKIHYQGLNWVNMITPDYDMYAGVAVNLYIREYVPMGIDSL